MSEQPMSWEGQCGPTRLESNSKILGDVEDRTSETAYAPLDIIIVGSIALMPSSKCTTSVSLVFQTFQLAGLLQPL